LLISLATQPQTQNLLGFRHDAIISQNSINLAQLAEDSKKDSASLIMLAKATGRDSRAVKLIAIITVIYLPGSFMAVSPQIARKWVSQVDRLAKTIFSTSFVSLASPDSSLPNAEQLKRATVAKEAGAYVATTVGLTLLTMALAYVWIREQERRERIDQEKASNPVDQA
jgi:mannitol-specific phosphotransferase system IIBC component